MTIYGYGCYLGEEKPPEFTRFLGVQLKRPTAKIQLDDGNVVYGNECWWTLANAGWQKFVGEREQKETAIDQARIEAARRHRPFGAV